MQLFTTYEVATSGMVIMAPISAHQLELVVLGLITNL